MPPRVACRSLAVLSLFALAACHGGQQSAASAPPAPAPIPPAAQALLDQLPPAYHHVDLDNGRLHLNLCRPCHTFTQGGPNMTGPNLYGVFGRRVASVKDFSYSPALASKSWTWDADHLDRWLKSPRAYVPGTKMTFYGIPDDQDRHDLIGYLKVVTSGGPS